MEEDAVSMAAKHNVTAYSLRPRRSQRLPERLHDTLVTAETTGSRGVPIEEYRVHVYYSTLDKVVEEMNHRFSDLNLSLLGALQALLPNSDKL